MATGGRAGRSVQALALRCAALDGLCELAGEATGVAALAGGHWAVDERRPRCAGPIGVLLLWVTGQRCGAAVDRSSRGLCRLASTTAHSTAHRRRCSDPALTALSVVQLLYTTKAQCMLHKGTKSTRQALCTGGGAAQSWMPGPLTSCCRMGCDGLLLLTLAAHRSVPPPRRPAPSAAGCVPGCWRRRPAAGRRKPWGLFGGLLQTAS